jgi:hypothetical protein
MYVGAYCVCFVVFLGCVLFLYRVLTVDFNFWYWLFIISNTLSFIHACVHCQSYFLLLCVLYSISFSMCFFLYKNFISWFSLHLTAGCFVFALCWLLPFILIPVYFGCKCWLLRVLWCHIATLVFSNFELVFLQVLIVFACRASATLMVWVPCLNVDLRSGIYLPYCFVKF